MDIQIDSREKARAIKKIVQTFEKEGVNYFSSKLLVGDYMNLDNPRLIIDRKQDIQELHGNVCQQHERFKRELLKAMQANIQLIVLIEHGEDIKSLEDVYFFYQPPKERWRCVTRIIAGAKRKFREKYMQQAIDGKTMYKSMRTIRDRYNVRFEFCEKKDTGRKIIELLGQKHEQ